MSKVNVVKETQAGNTAEWALFYLEKLLPLLEKAKARGEFVPNYEKIKALIAQKGK